jgi:hypothetical protein
MPYQSGNRLPGERASKLGHLEVLKSDLVNRLCRSFEDEKLSDVTNHALWESLPVYGQPLTTVFGVDGSLQPIKSDIPPHKQLTFVKTALLRIDEYALNKVDKATPHPFVLRDIMAESAVYHSTVFPLKHITLQGQSLYHAVRQIIFDSISDPSLGGEPLETLKWLVYEKWSDNGKALPYFECPHCEYQKTSMPFDAAISTCSNCGHEVLVTDFLGFHLDMTEDAISDSVATAYMNIHETLLLFTGIRHFWETNKHQLTNCLFIKDGPLSIRAQYSKLVAPIRRFIAFAFENGIPVHLIGQEKSGRFYDHLELIGRNAPACSIFVPGDEYIKVEIHNRPNRGGAYGKDTNYGAKVFLKTNEYHQMIIGIPTKRSSFVPDPSLDELIGIDRIVATMPKILSNKYEGALLPIELAHGVASLSSYPSAQILKLFSNSKIAP